MRKKRVPQPGPERAGPEGAGEVLDLSAAAQFLKVSQPTFYRWLAQGKIKGFKAGTQWRFYRRDLEQFLRAEEPSALTVDEEALRKAVTAARAARKLEPVEWPDAVPPEEGGVIRTVNIIIQDAIDSGASDIHIDAGAQETLVRYRIDGVLHEVMSLPKQAAHAMVSRLKLTGDMDISERRLPQNGRIHIRHKGKDYDVRVTTIPAVFGESAICRLLDQTSVLIGPERLGLKQTLQAALQAKLRVPNGLLVVTGPAGSGRTTTAYSCLSLIASPRVKVCTIEDPVEYRLPNVMQVHVNRKAGLTFAAALRSFMRADPDIIMVGDLRDLETAEGCINAAMTGHLVLTTMLPPDAPSVVSRLMEMGLEPFLISASLVAVVAQRLVRRVCPDCTKAYDLSPGLSERLEKGTGLGVSQATFSRGKGCEACRQTGYRGRIALFELMEVDDTLRELIARSASASEIRSAAVAHGMTTLFKDGIEKAMSGITTVEEVMRVLAHHERNAP